MSKVTLKHVYKVYEGGVRAVNDYNLEIKDKEFIVFVGPSGCGKSTTLRMIAGLENITAGQIYIDDVLVNDVESKDRDIAMVFQNYALYPHMTVFQNMAFGLKLRREDPKAIEARVKKAAETLEITDLLSRKPKALSGGQRQRVALGRAIVREPKVFLLDEPLSNLDAKLRVQMRTEITKLHKKLETTFVYVTHDQTEAMTMGDRIVVMKAGYIQQVDTPVNLYENPTNLFVATFLGSPQMNILSCQLDQTAEGLFVIVGDSQTYRLKIPPTKAKELSDSSCIGKKQFLGLRPEHIKIAAEGIPAAIDVVEQLGDQTIIHARMLDLPDDIVIKVPFDGTRRVKDQVFLAPDMNQAHLFDGKSQKSIMGVPQENSFPCHLTSDKLIFANNELTLPENYRKRVLDVAHQEKKLFFAFPIQSVATSPRPNSFPISGTIDFVVQKTDSSIVFLSLNGCDKHLVYSLPFGEIAHEGEKKTVYVSFDDSTIRNELGIRFVLKEDVLPNVTMASLHSENGKTVVRFGNNKVVMPLIPGGEGIKKISIAEDKVRPIFNKKQCKKLKLKNEDYDHSRLIKVSAYDEDKVNQKNVVFVEVNGFDNYATFVIPDSVSVYQAPKFELYLEDGAITVIE